MQQPDLDQLCGSPKVNPTGWCMLRFPVDPSSGVAMFSARTDKRPRLCAYWCYTGPIVGSCDDMIVDGWFTNVYYMILYIYIYIYMSQFPSYVFPGFARMSRSFWNSPLQAGPSSSRRCFKFPKNGTCGLLDLAWHVLWSFWIIFDSHAAPQHIKGLA